MRYALVADCKGCGRTLHWDVSKEIADSWWERHALPGAPPSSEFVSALPPLPSLVPAYHRCSPQRIGKIDPRYITVMETS